MSVRKSTARVDAAINARIDEVVGNTIGEAQIKDKAKPVNGTKKTRVEELQDELHMHSESFWRALNGWMPTIKPNSWQATYIKLVSRVCLYAFGVVGALYLTGLISMVLVNFGVPIFLVMVAEIICLVMGCVAAWQLSDAAVNYLADGNLSKDCRRLGGWIKNKFAGAGTFAKQRMAMH